MNSLLKLVNRKWLTKCFTEGAVEKPADFYADKTVTPKAKTEQNRLFPQIK